MLEDTDEMCSADVFITPPSNHDISDEDSGDEDGGTVNNLSGSQLNAASTATIVVGTEKKMIGCEDDDDRREHEQNETDADSVASGGYNGNAQADIENDSSHESDTENVAKRRKKIPTPRRWVRRDLPPTTKDQFPWIEIPSALSEKSFSPTTLFELFFDDDVIEMMRLNTNSYARQKGNHLFDVSPEEVKTFLAILLTSGYSVLPRRRMYWEQNNDVHNAAVSSAMARNRFEEIMQYLHVADNASLSAADKMAKIRPLYAMLNERFLLYNPKEQSMCVDESMIPYYGRHGCKQFIRGKPIRFGFKNWCLNTSSGYLIQCEPYQGQGTTRQFKDLGMGGSVVLDLISELPSGISYQLYFDNLFTSLKLLEELSMRGIAATGTVRVNRVEKCPLVDPKKMKKAERGHYDHRLDTSSNIVLVRWHDNSIVTMASNCHGVMPLGKAKRWSAAQKKAVEVQQPHLFAVYNRGMGGTDRMDQNISTYRISIRSKKWWWPLFAYMPDVAMQNAWLLYRKSSATLTRPMDLLQFRREVCQVYLTRYAYRSNIGRPMRQQVCLDRRVLADVRFDGREHYPECSLTQLRCGSCRGKSKYKCTKCHVGLHIQCFVSYHSQ